jgi:hypothetical protein
MRPASVPFTESGVLFSAMGVLSAQDYASASVCTRRPATHTSRIFARVAP